MQRKQRLPSSDPEFLLKIMDEMDTNDYYSDDSDDYFDGFVQVEDGNQTELIEVAAEEVIEGEIVCDDEHQMEFEDAVEDERGNDTEGIDVVHDDHHDCTQTRTNIPICREKCGVVKDMSSSSPNGDV